MHEGLQVSQNATASSDKLYSLIFDWIDKEQSGYHRHLFLI